MAAEERPPKIRKLSHSSETHIDQITTIPPQGQKLTPPTDANTTNLNQEIFPVQEDDDPQLATSPSQPSPKPLSKNQLKKLRRQQEWEAGKKDRRIKRKEKIKEKRVRKRTQREQEAIERIANGLPAIDPAPLKYQRPVRLPITFVIDCGFDDKMADRERISLGAQLTRAYSDNAKAPYQAHMVVSSWNGLLRERFDGLLRGQYRNWKDVKFMEEDFVAAADMARAAMQGTQGGRMKGVFTKYASKQDETSEEAETIQQEDDDAGTVPETTPETNNEATHDLPEPEIVYLTSDSPHTLTHLHPYSTYIIGGIVDKNRHKNLCYTLATQRGIKTAKLPIGEFMEMQSRFVLATNHVVEIMVRWLECGDWGESFLKVIPKRKGGKLRERRSMDREGTNQGGDGEEEEDVDEGSESEDDGVRIEVEG